MSPKRHFNALCCLSPPLFSLNVHNLVVIATHFAFGCVRVPHCDVMNIKHISDMQSGNNSLASSGVKKYTFCFFFGQTIVFLLPPNRLVSWLIWFWSFPCRSWSDWSILCVGIIWIYLLVVHPRLAFLENKDSIYIFKETTKTELAGKFLITFLK